MFLPFSCRTTSPSGTASPTTAGDLNLRVLPFGDSITAGFQSSDWSGYRCRLSGALNGLGDPHNFVGSLSEGSCDQPHHEGHSGWTVSQLQSIEKCTITGYQPNVVLLDIGANDVNGGAAPGPAAAAEEHLIESILTDGSARTPTCAEATSATST
jgi:lysophospholipase L1-like esterase